jgi:hypothetical protein
MKIKPEHYAHMRKAISAISAADMAAHRQHIVNEGKAQDVEKRLRWDLSYRAGLSRWIADNVYSYADDTHIDTALRAIMRELYGPEAKSL